ncbi:tRNA (cytosine(38)-C(5))-methyltransferase [Anopheles bellator]|uniref:tRNA (cytosine(38)-C(5))-methyltransferase n=1 Tax=Anopheles bellator TaxID=139047 RepID=UPI0026498A43|nr:tRNA (cytosine(38)-C(5))-methyltransferase [Anopheles bellator]
MDSATSKQNSAFRVLELFSGIGGMRMALERTGKPFEIVSAIDINQICKICYMHNFGEQVVRNGNILSLTASGITKMRVDTILMSPPCQPFSRNGKFNDLDDFRAKPFHHICALLEDIPTVQFILMENVKGFETSQACALYKDRLQNAGFIYQEYVLSPHQFGIPNTRHRYYCIAKRKGSYFKWNAEGIISQPPNAVAVQPVNIGEITKDSEATESYLLKEVTLKRHLQIMDICTSESTNSMCFTKAYTHYAEGTGSVFSPLSKQEFDNIYQSATKAVEDDEKLELLRTLRVRYFTPQEVAKLMSFPEYFCFPDSVTLKQQWKLLGNSVNVHVVSFLLEEL